MPPLRLLWPYPESETPSKSPDTPQNELNCGRTTVGRPLQESLAQMGGAINEWEPTSDSSPGLIMGYLSKLPPSLLISIGFVMVPLVGILTHLTGPELSYAVFYSIPIVLVTWVTRRSIGLILSTFSALTWLIVDLTSGATYSHAAIPYLNGVSRLSSFFILTFVLSSLKRIVKQEKELSRIDFLTGIRNRRYFIELGLAVKKLLKRTMKKQRHTFSDKVYSVVAKIPKGETMTYKQVP